MARLPPRSKIPWHLVHRTGPRAMSRARQLVISATHRHCTVRFEGPVRLGPGFRLDIPDAGTLIIGSGVDFRRGFECEISGTGRVTIGAGSVFTGDALIQCTTSIDIGRRCAFGQALMMADGNHRFRDHTRHLLDQGYDYRPIVIEDGAVVMSKCTVMHSIGAGAIVAANSVVHRPVPAHTLVGGVPAHEIEYFGPPRDASAP